MNMIMTDKFSFQRMGFLMIKYLRDNTKNLILKLLVMYGVLIVIDLMTGLNHLHYYRNTPTGSDIAWNNFFPMIIMLTLGFGCLAASVMFEDLKSKESRSALFMIPATTFEKYLSRWILYIIGFPILYLIGFYFADAVRCIVLHILVPESQSISILDLREFFDNWHLPEYINPIIFSTLLFLSLQSFFVLGSVVWQPLSFFKTFGTIFLLFCVYILSAVWLTDALVEPGKFYGVPKTIDNSRTVFNGLYGLMTLVCLINWGIAYYRLKEAEIIKRW